VTTSGLAQPVFGLQLVVGRGWRLQERPMPQSNSRLFDDFAKLMSDAAGLAEGARREAETVLRAQLERLLSTMNVVTRDEFEAVREMAVLARAENDKLGARIAALEAKLAQAPETKDPRHGLDSAG
jgi:BMFP domain-containing protein YqiC